MPDELTTANPARPERPEIPALTGLRFVAAFSVLIAHGCAEILANHEAQYAAIYWIRQASGFGMTLFFVLSGFVIHYNYAHLVTAGGVRGIGAYLWARFSRLYPLFLLMTLGSFSINCLLSAYWLGRPERIYTILQALPYFLLSIQSWVYEVIGQSSLIGAPGGAAPITWSISTEWFFYFIYLALVWLILKLRTPMVTVPIIVAWSLAWSMLAAGVYDRTPEINAWAVAHFGPVADFNERHQDSFVRWLLYFSPYLRLGEFVLGALVAEFYVQIRKWKVSTIENSAGAVAFVVAAASVVCFTYMEYSPNVGVTILRQTNMNFALAPSSALLIFCAVRYRGSLFRPLTCRPAILLGEASYSIYLVHLVVLTIALKLSGSVVHGIWHDFVELLLLIIVILLISIALYAYYEAPARRVLRGLGRYRQLRAEAAAAADG